MFRNDLQASQQQQQQQQQQQSQQQQQQQQQLSSNTLAHNGTADDAGVAAASTNTNHLMLSPSTNNVSRAETVALDTRGRLAGKSRHKAFQDPCHPTQSLYYSPLAVQFIDTPEFQRLRRLKQLGTADTVFPGAVHSRFQHSLGTYFFAKHQMSILRDKQPELRLNSRDVEIVALAGLCHDLGHGPFSHAFETFISNAGVHFEHEEMSAKLVGRIVKSKRLLRADDELAAWDDVASFEPPPALSARDVLLIRCMIATTERTKHAALVRESLPQAKSFMMDIVCNSRNSIDVDKFDYLIRDAYFCGSSVRPSPHRLMDNCRVIGGVLCYRKKVLHAIYQLFNVRANNFREIYGHRVSKAIEFMIMDALRLVDAKLGISSSAADPAKFIRLDDSIVSVVRFRATEPANVNDADFRAALDLIERIERRDVYKAVFESLFRNERAAKQRIKVSEMVPALVARAEVALGANRVNADDVRIQVLNLNFAMGEKDPLKLVEIYDSEFDTVPRRPTQSDIGHLVPIIHDELLVRVFCTRPHDNEMCVALKRAARDYIGSLSLPPTPSATPVKPSLGGHGGRDTTSFAEQPSSAATAGIDPSDDAHAATTATSPLKLGRRKREIVALDQRAAAALEEDDNIESQQDEADLRVLLHQMQTAMDAALRLVDKKNNYNNNNNNNINNNVATTDDNNHGDVVQPRQEKKRARRTTNVRG